MESRSSQSISQAKEAKDSRSLALADSRKDDTTRVTPQTKSGDDLATGARDRSPATGDREPKAHDRNAGDLLPATGEREPEPRVPCAAFRMNSGLKESGRLFRPKLSSSDRLANSSRQQLPPATD